MPQADDQWVLTLVLTPGFALAEMPLYFQEEERVLANKFIDGIMHVNGRDFLMGDLHEWPKGTHDYSVDFMVRSSIWLRDFLDKDPIVMGIVAEVWRWPDAPLSPWVQATRSISAVPSALKRFMRATRIWTSAAWRSGSREAMRSPNDFRHLILASIRLRV